VNLEIVESRFPRRAAETLTSTFTILAVLVAGVPICSLDRKKAIGQLGALGLLMPIDRILVQRGAFPDAAVDGGCWCEFSQERFAGKSVCCAQGEMTLKRGMH